MVLLFEFFLNQKILKWNCSYKKQKWQRELHAIFFRCLKSEVTLFCKSYLKAKFVPLLFEDVLSLQSRFLLVKKGNSNLHKYLIPFILNLPRRESRTNQISVDFSNIL